MCQHRLLSTSCTQGWMLPLLHAFRQSAKSDPVQTPLDTEEG